MRIGYTQHALQKMQMFGLTRGQINVIVARDDVIERFADRDGALYCGRVRDAAFHVVVVTRVDLGATLVTTVYRPTADQFGSDLRSRR